MTAPIQEPSQQRTDQALAYSSRQLLRRPSPVFTSAVDYQIYVAPMAVTTDAGGSWTTVGLANASGPNNGVNFALNGSNNVEILSNGLFKFLFAFNISPSFDGGDTLLARINLPATAAGNWFSGDAFVSGNVRDMQFWTADPNKGYPSMRMMGGVGMDPGVSLPVEVEVQLLADDITGTPIAVNVEVTVAWTWLGEILST